MQICTSPQTDKTTIKHLNIKTKVDNYNALTETKEEIKTLTKPAVFCIWLQEKHEGVTILTFQK